MPERRSRLRRPRGIRRRWRVVVRVALLSIFAFPLAAPAQPLPADRADVDQLRRRLDRMEEQRRSARAEIPFGWERRPRPFELDREQRPDDRHAVIELHYAARGVSCFVRLTPADESEARPIHAPMLVPGSQWVRLESGRWRIELLAGYVTGPIIALPVAEVEIEGGEVYRLTFGPDEEIRARDLAREESERINRAGRQPDVSVRPSP